jgi:type II secretory pathway pseudopilin PulG
MRKGFTLFEAVIVIIIVVILAVVIALYIREGISAWQFFSGQKNLALSTRSAVNRVVRELKRCRQNTNITTHAAKEITFIDVDNKSVTFSQSGSDLMRDSDILLGNLRDPCGLTFTYLDEDGNQTAVPNQMRVVRCRLTVQEDANRFVIESAARIRIRKIR